MKSLKEWCSENNAQVLLELYENGNNKCKSDEIGFSSPKEVNFKCKKCGISWNQKLNKINRRKVIGCPYCLHDRLSYFYNLEIEYPITLKEWFYEKNIGKPSNYTPGSKEQVFWKCKQGHIWQNSIKETVRTIKNAKKERETLCPICNKEKVSKTYNLFTEFPVESGEWCYAKNEHLTPLNVSPKCQKEVWWICRYNPKHIWSDRISNRTILKRGCPECTKKFKISFPARAIYFYLSKIYEDCEMEYRMSNKYTADICLTYYKIIIEYDGWYYHSDNSSKEREKRKDEFLKGEGYEVIRIKEKKERIGEINYYNNVIEYHLLENKESLDELIKKIIKVIENKTNIITENDINVKRDFYKIEDLYYHIRKSNSLAVKRPDLAKEYSSNNEETLDNISIGTNKDVNWICPKCKREYPARINNRTAHNSNCPFCAIDRRKKHI